MIFITVAVILALLAGSVYGLVLAHEEKKAERAKWQRIASANSENRDRVWPPRPAGSHSTPWKDRTRA